VEGASKRTLTFITLDHQVSALAFCSVVSAPRASDSSAPSQGLRFFASVLKRVPAKPFGLAGLLTLLSRYVPEHIVSGANPKGLSPRRV